MYTDNGRWAGHYDDVIAFYCWNQAVLFASSKVVPDSSSEMKVFIFKRRLLSTALAVIERNNSSSKLQSYLVSACLTEIYCHLRM